MKELIITIGDERVKAKLLWDKAPQTCALIEKHAPLEGRLNHAKVCDNEVFFQVPFFLDEKENPVWPVAGDIGYWPVRQTVCIWYGDMKPLGPTNLFAKIVPEDLPIFAEIASYVWKKQGYRIKFQVGEEE